MALQMAMREIRRVGETLRLGGRKCSAIRATATRARAMRMQISRNDRFSFAVSRSLLTGYHLVTKYARRNSPGAKINARQTVRIFFHPDCTVGAGISPARRCKQRSRTCPGAHRRSGISPCPEDPLRLTQKSLDDKAFDL